MPFKKDIHTREDLKDFGDILQGWLFTLNVQHREPKPFTVTIKSYRKDKTSKQHRYYFSLLGKIVKGLKEIGYDDVNSESLNEFFKRKIDYCEQKILPNGEALFYTKSISDKSEDVNRDIMKELIEFSQKWAAENLELIL